MSNQANGFKGFKPFVTDKQFQNLSLDEIRNILEEEKEGLKKDYKELGERRKLIKQYKKIKEAREKVRKGIDIKKENKKKTKISKPKKIKSFEDYFEECIKNKEIPKDTPSYFRKALKRAIKEFDQGLLKEKSSLDNFANKYIIEGEPGVIPVDFLTMKYKILKEFFKYHRNIKFSMVLVCLMEQQILSKDKGVVGLNQDKAYFRSGTYINLESTDVDILINECIEDLIEKLEEYQKNGSGWYFNEVVQLEIHTVEYNPTKGSSYIPLPDWIKNKKAIVNIKNKDEKCFLWCILRYLNPIDKHEERLEDLKKYEFSLNTKGISFPIKLKDITKFEKLNPSLPGINVFSNEKNNVFYPLRMAERDCLNTIDLFLYEEDGVSHYTLIKNISCLLRSQITKRTNEPIQICKKCFSHYTKPELLEKHIKYCSNNETVAVKVPKANTMLYFKNYEKQLPVPFVVYADFECFTKPMNTCSPNPKESYNYNYQKHEPSGFCFYMKGIVDTVFSHIFYTKTKEDEDISKVFVDKLAKVTNKIYNDFYRRPISLRLTRAEQKSFDEAETCHICKKELLDDKVRDHCHFTGKYRGAAHNRCNLQCKKPRVLPVVFHNLQGYDAHLFIKQLACLEGELQSNQVKRSRR